MNRTLFGVPVLVSHIDEADAMNRELEAMVLSLESTTPSVSQSNVGGWQSPRTLGQRQSAPIVALLDHIKQAVGKFVASSPQDCSQVLGGASFALWANVNRRSHFNGPHDHVGAFLSGVYYPAPCPMGGGEIIFRDPGRSGAMAEVTCGPDCLKAMFSREIAITPEAGMLLLFPSWLEHWVVGHTTDEPRVSLAFDILFPFG